MNRKFQKNYLKLESCNVINVFAVTFDTFIEKALVSKLLNGSTKIYNRLLCTDKTCTIIPGACIKSKYGLC